MTEWVEEEVEECRFTNKWWEVPTSEGDWPKIYQISKL